MAQTCEIACGSAQLNRQIPAFHSQIAKPLEDRFEKGVPTSRICLEQDSNPPGATRWWGGGLSLGHERRRKNGRGGPLHESAAVHYWITSSARSSTDGGMVRPSAF